MALATLGLVNPSPLTAGLTSTDAGSMLGDSHPVCTGGRLGHSGNSHFCVNSTQNRSNSFRQLASILSSSCYKVSLIYIIVSFEFKIYKNTALPINCHFCVYSGHHNDLHEHASFSGDQLWVDGWVDEWMVMIIMVMVDDDGDGG